MPNDEPLMLDASAYVDQMRRAEDATAAHVAAVHQAFYEIERRDGAAHWHSALWFRFACALAVVLMVALGVIAYLALQASRVAVFVQPVQITEEGKMVLVGIPQDVLAYQPEDGAWMDLVSQYVIKRRWKGDDEQMKRTRNDWAWLYHHSCGFASKTLAADEGKEQPFKANKRRASIEVKSITKTATPESWQVVFHEVSLDSQVATLKEQDWIATFTVGRLRPKTLAEAIDNHLGLCVTGVDMTPSTTKIP